MTDTTPEVKQNGHIYLNLSIVELVKEFMIPKKAISSVTLFEHQSGKKGK